MFALKILFALSSVLYILFLVFLKFYFSKKKSNVDISNYIALMAVFLAVYVLSGLILVVFLKGILYKSIILLFAMTPFIIGKIATYEKEKLYTLTQFILMFISIIFVISC